MFFATQVDVGNFGYVVVAVVVAAGVHAVYIAVIIDIVVVLVCGSVYHNRLCA